LGEAGLRVVLGTPTATPPKWLVERHPEVLPVGPDGRARGFGSRRHYSFSSEAYREHTRRIVTALARRYGRNAHVAGWQTDNEYGCHDTVRDYGPESLQAFRRWLAARYDGVDALNRAWGTVFWSQEYRRFDQVELPHGTVTEANPAHWLDFLRFCSDQVRAYNRLQADILRQHARDQFVLHNFMGFFSDFDHFKLGEDLDLASWDSYPLGNTDLAPLPEATKRRYARTGHPDLTAFNHDLYRAVGRGRFWVMEQQPGPVNWAPHNPSPAPGMVRLWSWEALAHGAEVVSYFRWRQAPFAQEQMHAGLNRPDGAPDVASDEVRRVGEELASLDLEPPQRASVALVLDYESGWFMDVQPQGAGARYRELAFAFYRALRGLGFDVDVVPPGGQLTGYGLVVVPSLVQLSPEALAALQACAAPVVCGPRTGSKTASFQIPDDLPPGPLQALLPLKVTRVESLGPWSAEAVHWQGAPYEVGVWKEWVETDLPPSARFEDGRGAAFVHEGKHYLAFWPTGAFLHDLLASVAADAGLRVQRLPEGLRLRRRGRLTFAFNFEAEPQRAPAPTEASFVLGGLEVAPFGVSAWEGG